MATVPTQIRIDENLKKQASELFSQLGMDMSSAMNIFLRQCVMRGGLPFAVEVPKYKKEVIDAMEEAKRISKDPNVKGYTDLNEMFDAQLSIIGIPSDIPLGAEVRIVPRILETISRTAGVYMITGASDGTYTTTLDLFRVSGIGEERYKLPTTPEDTANTASKTSNETKTINYNGSGGSFSGRCRKRPEAGGGGSAW